MSDVINNRYDFTVLFEVENGNPNGDPDSGNMPRIDPETGHGLVTDVCLKRKVRNFVQMVKEGEEGYQIYVRKGAILNNNDQMAYTALGIEAKQVKDMKKKDPDIDRKVRDWMCSNFYDIRTFGAVMTTFTKDALNCGQVTGPVQLGFAKSVSPVMPQELTISRVAITTEKDAQEKSNEFGKKYILPYALYRVDGHVSANLAKKTTGFTEEDLELFWNALINMFEDDHSAARGNMNVRKLIVFKHDSIYGNAPAYKLFEAVHITEKEGIVAPRSYYDYEVTIDENSIPDGVALEIKL